MALVAVEKELAKLKAEVASCTDVRDAVLRDMQSNTLIRDTASTNRVEWQNPMTYLKSDKANVSQATTYPTPEFESDDHQVAYNLISTYSQRQMRLNMAKDSLATFQRELRTLAGVPGHSRDNETLSIPGMLKTHAVKTAESLGVYLATGSDWVFGPENAPCRVNYLDFDTLCRIFLETHSPEELNRMVRMYAGKPVRVPELDKKASKDLEKAYKRHDETANQRAVKTALKKLERVGEDTVIDTGPLLGVMEGTTEQGTKFLTKFVTCLNFILHEERIELKSDKRTRDKKPQLVMYEMEEFEQNSVKHLIEELVFHGGAESTKKWMRRRHFLDAGVDMDCFDSTWDSFFPVTVIHEDEDEIDISELRERIPLPPCGADSIGMYRKVEAYTKAHESKRTRLE